AVLLPARAAAAVVGRVEARALVVHGHRVQHAHHRRGAADLAARRPRLAHRVELLDEVAVRALVLVDRHGRARVPSPDVARRLLLVTAAALLWAPGAWAHATPLSSSPVNGSVLATPPLE